MEKNLIWKELQTSRRKIKTKQENYYHFRISDHIILFIKNKEKNTNIFIVSKLKGSLDIE